MTVIVENGDWIIDRMNDGEMRKVVQVVANRVDFEDGGFMALDEITHDDIKLPGEVPGFN